MQCRTKALFDAIIFTSRTHFVNAQCALVRLQNPFFAQPYHFLRRIAQQLCQHLFRMLP
jgi:hypothetical protein